MIANMITDMEKQAILNSPSSVPRKRSQKVTKQAILSDDIVKMVNSEVLVAFVALGSSWNDTMEDYAFD